MMADVGENSNKAALSGLLCRWVGGALRPAAGGIHPPPLLPVFVHHPPSSPPSPPSSLSTSQAFTLPAGHQEPQTFRSPIDSDTTGRTTVSVSISYCLIFCLTCGKGTKFSLNLGLKVLTNSRNPRATRLGKLTTPHPALSTVTPPTEQPSPNHPPELQTDEIPNLLSQTTRSRFIEFDNSYEEWIFFRNVTV